MADKIKHNFAFPPPGLHPRLSELDKRTFLKAHEALIGKIEAGQQLSINERVYVGQALRLHLLPKHELRRRDQQQKLKHIEATKKIAKLGVPYGLRAAFTQELTGYSGNPEALRKFARRARKRRSQ